MKTVLCVFVAMVAVVAGVPLASGQEVTQVVPMVPSIVVTPPADSPPSASIPTPDKVVPPVPPIRVWIGTIENAYGGKDTITVRFRDSKWTYDSSLVRNGRSLENVPLVGTFSNGVLDFRDPTSAFGGLAASIAGDEMVGSFVGSSGKSYTLKAKEVK